LPHIGARPTTAAARGAIDSRVLPDPGGGQPVETGVAVCDDRDMRWVLVVVGSVALGVLAYRVQVNDLFSPRERAAAQLAIGWTFVAAGLVVWIRRKGNRIGPLMVAAGVAWLARQLRYADSAVLFTLFFLLGDLCYALVGHAILAYPSGRVRERFDRWLVAAGYTTVLAFPLAVLLLYDGRSALVQMQPLPHDDLIAIAESVRGVELLQKAEVIAFFGVLATLLLFVIVRRLVRATPRERRIFAPLLVAAIAVAMRAVFECVFTFVDRPFAYDYLFWWQFAAVIALPIALMAGLLRARLARSAVGELVIELDHTPTSGLRDALARALDDDSLELALALPGGGFVDEAGRPVALLPETDPRRAVSRIEHDGEVVAALVHDRSLLEEPQLVHAVGAAAHLALENARLQAELRAQLTLVEESRARIVAAGDDERRRIERDLHDGAQQRLVAMAIELRSAQRRLGSDIDPTVERLLSSTVDDLQLAVQELRELASGIHPTILAEGGLAAALDLLATRSALPVTLDATQERFAPEVEAAAYFVACEALANATKHAAATRATVHAQREGDVLFVEVTDDGSGGASIDRGTGLRGLADRVEALGGRLRVESPAGAGTRVVGEIPCAS
jgi:signal transduction histidine kinase